MTVALLFASLTLSSAPLVLVAIAGLGFVAPVPTLVAIGAMVIWEKRRAAVPAGLPPQAALLGGIAAELRAGQNLRGAIAGGIRRVPDLGLARVARLAESGCSYAVLAQELAIHVEPRGKVVGAAVRVAARSGGAVAQIFDQLASMASADVELDRERAEATTHAVFSAAVITALPVLFGLYLALSGRLGSLTGGGSAGLVLLVVGLVLLVSGVLAIGVIVRREARR